MKKITCIGYHETGSSAIDDFFKEFDNCASGPSDYEARLLQDPDGISDLEYNLVDNPHRLNSGFALKRFRIFCQRNRRTYEGIFGKRWLEEVEKFIDSLIKVKYKGYWIADLMLLNPIIFAAYKFRRGMRKVLPKDWRRQKDYNYLPNIDFYHTCLTEKEFIEKVQVFVERLCELLSPNGKEFLLLDQFLPTTNIQRYLRYINDIKVIIADRDPRDVYVQILKDHVMPKDPVQYCIAYKDYRKTRDEEAKDIEHVLVVQFEDLIYKYDEMMEKVVKFVGEDWKHHIMPKAHFNPQVSKKNIQQWKGRQDLAYAITIIEHELPEYLYSSPFVLAKGSIEG